MPVTVLVVMMGGRDAARKARILGGPGRRVYP